MTSRDFCYWLQGYFEIHGAGPRPPEPQDIDSLPAYKVNIIKRHLEMVFKHEIDPSMGMQKHQEELTDIHAGLARPTAEGTPRC